MSLESGVILGTCFITVIFYLLSKVMDDKWKDKDVLMHWRHIWLTMLIFSAYWNVNIMREFIEENATFGTGITDLLELGSIIFNLIILAWIIYIMVFTVKYLLKFFNNDEINYE